MISSREVMRRLKDAGWEQAYANGSHHYFIHPKQPERGKVTVKHPTKGLPDQDVTEYGEAVRGQPSMIPAALPVATDGGASWWCGSPQGVWRTDYGVPR